MYRIARLAAVAALLGLTLFAVGCGSKTDDTNATPPPAAAKSDAAAKTDGTDTTGAAGKPESGAMSGQSQVLPPPPNAVKK